jgi:hypothetical protein
MVESCCDGEESAVWGKDVEEESGVGREGGSEGFRRDVKSTADEDRCIREADKVIPLKLSREVCRLSWGESSTKVGQPDKVAWWVWARQQAGVREATWK